MNAPIHFHEDAASIAGKFLTLDLTSPVLHHMMSSAADAVEGSGPFLSHPSLLNETPAEEMLARQSGRTHRQ
jgi:hypothetical protein